MYGYTTVLCLIYETLKCFFFSKFDVLFIPSSKICYSILLVWMFLFWKASYTCLKAVFRQWPSCLSSNVSSYLSSYHVISDQWVHTDWDIDFRECLFRRTCKLRLLVFDSTQKCMIYLISDWTIGAEMFSIWLKSHLQKH